MGSWDMGSWEIASSSTQTRIAATSNANIATKLLQQYIKEQSTAQEYDCRDWIEWIELCKMYSIEHLSLHRSQTT